MKGRFRKGKKAFKNNRHGKLFNQYKQFLLKIEIGRKQAIIAVQLSVSSAMAMAQIRSIQQAIGISPAKKALKIADEVIDAHRSFVSIAKN